MVFLDTFILKIRLIFLFGVMNIVENYENFFMYVFFSFFLFIQGCAMPNIAKDYKFDSNSPDGLLVGSITFDGYYAKYSLHILNLETNEVDHISAGGAITPFHLFDPKGNLDHLGVKGDLFAVKLKPGDYEIYSWSVAPGNGALLSSPGPFSIKLKIKPGEALYFGSVNFKQTETFGVTISSAEAFYLNQYDRDVKEFKENYGNINLPNVNTVMKEGQTLSLGGDARPGSLILFRSISRNLGVPTP